MPEMFGRRILSKKGVSPLIATVLLIAFAVALGAVVMNWGKGYVQAQAINVETKSNAQLSCQGDIELNIYVLNQRPKICYELTDTGTTLSAMLKNEGTMTIKGITVTIVSSNDDVFSTEIDKDIVGGGVVKVDISVNDTEFGDIRQVEFTPKILVSGVQKPVLCSKNSKNIDEIYACE
jgi:flagellin-like protein